MQFSPFPPSNPVKGVNTVQEGHHQANQAVLERLMEEYGSNLLRMCALYLKDAALAQDAVQDTFIKAYRRFHTYRGESSEKTWLTSIARNVCRDYLRTAWFKHQNRRTNIDSLPEIPCDFAFPDNTVLTEVMRLPVKYREVVLLRYYQGMKLTEVAAALGLTEGKTRGRLNRANAILKDRLKEWYDEEA